MTNQTTETNAGQVSAHTLCYDGKGINGPDKYRSRIATFVSDDAAKAYGPMFAATPELIAAACNARALIKALMEHSLTPAQRELCRDALAPLNNAIAKATGQA